jgi:hypothetical protein
MERLDWVRRLNYFGSAVGGARNLITLDPAELLEVAKASTGLSDFGDDDWHEAFDKFVTSIDEDTDLHALGRFVSRADILRALRNRLLVVDALKKNPEILDEKIVSPVLIAGQGRSGTSILFELLSEDSNNRAPLAWEAASPVEPPVGSVTDGVTRAEIAQCDNEFWDDAQPEIKVAHEHRWDLPAECIRFTNIDFSSDYWTMLYSARGYHEWKFTRNPTSSYDWHEKLLKLLQYGQTPRRWLLKSPAHVRFLDVLLGHYPDLRIIQTHRDPIKTVPSTVSLSGHMRWMRANDVDLELLAGMISATYKASLEKVIEQRENGTIPAGQIADIHFQDLMTDAVATIRAAYEKLGLEFTEDYAQKIQAYLAAKPRGKFGKHRYQPEDYGLSKEGIHKDFEFYTNYFGVALEE